MRHVSRALGRMTDDVPPFNVLLQALVDGLMMIYWSSVAAKFIAQFAGPATGGVHRPDKLGLDVVVFHA